MKGAVRRVPYSAYENNTRRRECVVMGGENAAFYDFGNILNGIFVSFSLADTSGKPRTFCHPVANLTGIEDYLAHRSTSRESLPRASHVQGKGDQVRPRGRRKRREF